MLTTEQVKRPVGTTVAYVLGSLLGLITLVALINQILLFNTAVTQYVAAGYARADVVGELLPGQLLPGLFEITVLYGGIAFIVFWAGMLYHKVALMQGALTVGASQSVVDTASAEDDLDDWIDQQFPHQPLEDEPKEVAIDDEGDA